MSVSRALRGLNSLCRKSEETEKVQCGLEGGVRETIGFAGRTESLFEMGDHEYIMEPSALLSDSPAVQDYWMQASWCNRDF